MPLPWIHSKPSVDRVLNPHCLVLAGSSHRIYKPPSVAPILSLSRLFVISPSSARIVSTHRTSQATTTSKMSSLTSNPTNGAHTNGNGKAPEVPHSQQQQQPQPTSLVQVQPARVEDLQPRYAQQIKHDDENPDAHGWYASMSKSFRKTLSVWNLITNAFLCSTRTWRMHWLHGIYPVLHLLSQSVQIRRSG